MQLAVGGSYDAVGRLERDLLIACGLPRDGALVDVGCGSGRLASQLASWLQGTYLGTDIVPELLEYAREQVPGHPDWRFELVDGLTIPAADASADVVSLFSVLTHLSHEDGFKYLREAARVTKPGGRVVLSFLEFRIAAHWPYFEGAVDGLGHDVLTQFISRDAIAAFATHLALSVEAVYDGDKPHIPLSEAVHWDDGTVMEGMGKFIQSVAVLRRPADSTRPAAPG